MTKTVHNRRLSIIFLIIGLLLMVPLVAMLFTEQVKWSVFDFLVAAMLLSGTGLAMEFVLRKFKNTTQRFIICGIVLVVLLLIWMELAVGIFGTPFAGS